MKLIFPLNEDADRYFYQFIIKQDLVLCAIRRYSLSYFYTINELFCKGSNVNL